MAKAQYKVLQTAQIGADGLTASVYEADAVITLDEEVGDACDYVERVDGKKKKAPVAEK